MDLRRRIVARRFRSSIERHVRPAAFGAYGSGTVVHPPLHAPRREDVHVGDSTYVLSGAQLLTGGSGGGSTGRITVGSGTYLGRDLTIVAHELVEIGDDVMGSDRLYLADTELIPGPDGPVPSTPRPVRIGAGVFLGTGAMVLPGVTVGARSLVAAGAVVDRDVPPNAVVAGNPARVVRRFDPGAGGWVQPARD
ncbi:acyltransferase [Conexibacter sp. W3-3-2]|uniref:acyltransferase n=1 Tax=Conexibacter sp. W3-3-2 TaxID=2675227 RepID=UPI0028150C0A|nr:acyltransferase [Conexibacter sp. W3-3-2]